MKNKLNITMFYVMILILSTFLHRIMAAEEPKWQPVPIENYDEVLEIIAGIAKANYERISTWQGRMNIHEDIHYYGSDAAKTSHGVNTKGIAHNSKHICRTAETIAEFAIDMHNDKLYSSVDPNVQYKAVDLEQFVPKRENTSTPKTITILSPERYIWYMPEEKFNPISGKGKTGKAVFIESPQNENVKGFVRDPRMLFESSGEDGIKLWDSLLQNLKSKLPDRINMRIAGYPHIEISFLDTQNGIKYRILTTWRGEKNADTNYIRCTLEVDEEVGFNATKTKTIDSAGVTIDSKEYTYDKIGEVYIPKTVKKKYYNHDSKPVFMSNISIETTCLNEPLPESTFSIKNLGIEEGTLITDKIKNAEFRYSKGALVPISETNNTK